MIPIFFIVLPIKSFHKHSKNLPILHRSFSQFSIQFSSAFLCGMLCCSMFSCLQPSCAGCYAVPYSVDCSLLCGLPLSSVQFLVVSLCGLHCRRLSRAVGVGRVGQRAGRLAEYNPLTRVNARLVFPLPDTLFRHPLPTPSSRHSPLQRPHLQYTFHQLLLSHLLLCRFSIPLSV